MKKVLLSGNEAVARGAYEAGVHIATAYPGTPSTEILENIVIYDEIYSEWAPNEKVAMEVAIGGSFGGARSLVAMKHVGLNVAADPLFSFSYTGTDGGMIIVSADDPSMHSSQNEQDNRRYAKFAKIYLLEPADSQEAKDFVKLGMEISERFGTPVLLRMSTRLCHSKTVVELRARDEFDVKAYEKDIRKRVVIPAHARQLHKKVEKRLQGLKEYNETAPFNRMEMKDTSIGIITSGISYQYARESFPEYSFLKLGSSFPFPDKLVQEFASKVDKLWVIEENEPFIEEALRNIGIEISAGKDSIPLCWELNQKIVKESLTDAKMKTIDVDRVDLPPRPPVLCPGCPHRGIFYEINKMGLTATSDIGCYTLGVLPPLNAGETCICMGASIGNAFGLELAQGKEFGKNTVALIGDSTFVHSGMTGLAEIAYNKGNITVVILDNSITAMTGHQEHPGTGVTLKGEQTVKLDYLKLAESIGLETVFATDAYDLADIRKALEESTSTDGPALIVNKGKCILRKKGPFKSFQVDAETCIGCKVCLSVGCPAISLDDEEGVAVIDEIFCVGDACSICQQVCPVDAIS